MAPWIGLQTAYGPPLPNPPLITMITMSTNSAQPAVIAMTLKNPRAFRAAAKSRIGRTCSDIRCLSCFTSFCFTSSIFEVVTDHPPPHVRSEQREHPPLQGVCPVSYTHLTL